MEDLDHVFHPSSIERMEVTLLEALEWRLCCPTAYSYIQLLAWKLESIEAEVEGNLMVKITELLDGAVLDYRLMAFRPSLIALSTICCCLDLVAPITSQQCLSHFLRLFNQHYHKVNKTKIPPRLIMILF